MGWDLPEQLEGSSSRSGHNRRVAVEADTIGEQQLKWMQLGSGSRSECNRGAVETDTIESSS